MSDENQEDTNETVDFEVIREPVKLTKLDKARIKLRSLEDKRDELQAKANLTSSECRRLAMLDVQISSAQNSYARENQRAADDLWRLRRAIDDWRATEDGRQQWNQSRRKVRINPNSDLSGLTPEQKQQHARDRRSDANWIKRQRDKGVPEVAIMAALETRIEIRLRDRVEADKLADLPTFGRF